MAYRYEVRTQKSLWTNHPRHWHVGIISLFLVLATPQSRASDVVYSHEEGAPARVPFGGSAAARAAEVLPVAAPRLPVAMRLSAEPASSILPFGLSIDGSGVDDVHHGIILLFPNKTFHAALQNLQRRGESDSLKNIVQEIFDTARFTGSRMFDLAEPANKRFHIEVPEAHRVAFAILHREKATRARYPAPIDDAVGRVYPGKSYVVSAVMTPLLRSGCRGFMRGRYRPYQGLGVRVLGIEDKKR